MTQLQKEIQEIELALESLGYLLVNGFYDEDQNPELYGDLMAHIITGLDAKREQQEATFQQMPWIRTAANR